MEQTILTINIPNTVTIWLMAFVGFTALALAARAYKSWQASKTAS